MMKTHPPLPTVDPDGLVLFPQETSSALLWRVVLIGVLIVFFLTIFGTPIVDFFYPAPPIRLIGRERGQDRQLRQQARWLDGSLFKLWEHDLRLRSRVRRWVTDQYAWILYSRLGHVENQLVCGKEGELFLRSRIELPDNMSDEDIIRRSTNCMASLQRRVLLEGFDFFAIPIPRKAALLSSELPTNTNARPELDQKLGGNLQTKGIASVNLWPIMNSLPGLKGYYLLGSHWDDKAQLESARLCCRAAGLLIPKKKRQSTLQVGRPVLPGGGLDLLAFAGMSTAGHRFPDSAGMRPIFIQDSAGKPIRKTRAEKPNKTIIIGTSFSDERKFPIFLEHFSGLKIWNGAHAGRFSGINLADLLRNRGKSNRGGLLLFEIPNHQLFMVPFRALTEPLNSLPPPPYLSQYFSPGPGMLKVRKNSDVTIKDREQLILHIPNGRIAHTNDGALALMLEGDISRPLVLRVRGKGIEPTNLRWEPEQKALFIPLVGNSMTSEGLWLSLSPSAQNSEASTLRLKKLKLVSQVQAQPRVDLPHPTPSQTAGGWEVIIQPPRECRATRLSLLELALAVKPSFAGDLQIEVSSPDGGPPFQARWNGLAGGALVVASLTSLQNRRIGRIRISGSGPAPRELLRRAALRLGRERLHSPSEALNRRSSDFARP